MVSILLILFTVVAAALAYRLVKWISNYHQARKLGLPILLSPVSRLDPWWPLIRPKFEPFENLPFCGWIGYSHIGWTFADRYKTHERLGSAFLIVSPNLTELFVEDPDACRELLSSWKVWTKPADMYRIFEVFGRNVNSVNGDDWQRHRKVASYGFKESISRTVWEESLRQGTGLCQDWSGYKEVLLSKLVTDVGTVAMNVLSAAGFGKRYDFDATEGLQKPDPGHKLSYGESLRFILQNMILTILFDSFNMPEFMMPAKLRKLKLAATEFRSYMQEKIQEEKDNLAAGADEKATLAAVLVRANEKERDSHDSSAKGVLTDNELHGNIFIFSLAGHETTAGVFSYSLPLLAAHPEVQDWVAEEVHNVFAKDPEYSRAFPRLVRCMAIMYETVRIWGPVQALPKTTLAPRKLRIDGHEYEVPVGIDVEVNMSNMHTSPKFWGEDNMQWKPRRWIRKDESGADALVDVAEMTFVGWSYGPRVCPGKKFSQVEYIAVLATILRGYRIAVALGPGETQDQANARLMGVVQDSFHALVVKMRHPEDAGIVLQKR